MSQAHTAATGGPQPRWLRIVTSARVRFGLLVAILAVGVVATIALAPEGAAERRELLDTVQSAIERAGPAAPIVYVVLYAAATVAFVPGAPLTMAGGALFGPWWGTGLAVIGATIGALGAFVVARRLGRAQVEALAGRRLSRIDRWLARQGFVAVLYLRLVIVVPFNLLNYVSGVTGVRRRDYVAATALGIIPAAFAFAAFGDVALAALNGDLEALLSPRFLSALALIAVLAVGGPIVHRQLKSRGLVPADDVDGSAAAPTNPDDASGERRSQGEADD